MSELILQRRICSPESVNSLGTSTLCENGARLGLARSFYAQITFNHGLTLDWNLNPAL